MDRKKPKDSFMSIRLRNQKKKMTRIQLIQTIPGKIAWKKERVITVMQELVMAMMQDQLEHTALQHRVQMQADTVTEMQFTVEEDLPEVRSLVTIPFHV